MNSTDQERPAPDPLELAMQTLKATEVPPLPATVLQETRRAIASLPRQQRWRPRLQLAAAALIGIMLCAIPLLVTPANTSLAFAEVANRVHDTKTLRAVVVDPQEGGALLVSGTRTRFEGPGVVAIADSATRQEIMLDSTSKVAYRIPHRPGGATLDFYGLIHALAEAATNPIDPFTDDAGKPFPGHQGQAAIKVSDTESWHVDAKVWSDPTTKLPVRMEVRSTDGGEVMRLQQIEFNVPLDDALFDTTIPAGYTVQGLSEDQLQPALSKEDAGKLTIVPTVGIGEIKFGMSREQVVAILGEPEFILHDSYLCYPSKGLQLVLAGGELNKLGMIIANPMDAASLTRNDFLGQTDRGIRIGSSRKEVHDAYGDPDAPLAADRPLPAPHRLERFSKLGLMFGFVDDQVKQIVISQLR